MTQAKVNIQLPQDIQRADDKLSVTLKEIYATAKTGSEDDIRGYLISIPEIISGLEQAYDRDFNSTYNEKRRARLHIKYYKLALTALRAGLTRHNRARKAQIKPKQQMMHVTPEAFSMMMKAVSVFNSIPKQDLTILKPAIDTNKPIITGDSAFDASANSIKEKFLAGQSFKEIAEEAKKEPTFSVEDLFKPNEDGSVEL